MHDSDAVHEYFFTVVIELQRITDWFFYHLAQLSVKSIQTGP
jgi:hypothetical protein